MLYNRVGNGSQNKIIINTLFEWKFLLGLHDKENQCFGKAQLKTVLM